VPADDLYAAAKLYAKSGVGALYYCMGITQHSHGVDNVKACVNLQLVTGNIGVEGGGVNPCAARTTCRAPATWAACPTSSPVTSP